MISETLKQVKWAAREAAILILENTNGYFPVIGNMWFMFCKISRTKATIKKEVLRIVASWMLYVNRKYK